MNVDIPIVNNRIILIGVNGTGKTTILTMLFYLMRGKWEELSRFYFEEISLEIDDSPFKYTFSDIENYLFESEPDIKILKERFFSDNPQELYELIFGTPNDTKLNDIRNKHNDAIDIREAILSVRKSYKKPLILSGRDDLPHTLKRHSIQFYPTFRRIEKDLNDIMDFTYNNQKITPDFHAKDLGIIHFGMHDAKKLIDDLLEQSKRFKKVSTTIQEKLSLNEISKLKIGQPSNNLNTKVYENNFQNTNAKVQFKIQLPQEQLINFAKTCNAYLSDSGKSIHYDHDNYLLKILNEHTQEITLEDLSFGEKQIVSFFAELYLSKKDNFIIIIDEPELSLSVRWQKRFLTDILATEKCSFLMAVTHSPFIYTDLEEYRSEITRLCTVNE